jgi:hypothetical protein
LAKANKQMAATRLAEVINPSTGCGFLTNLTESQSAKDHSLSALISGRLLAAALTCVDMSNPRQ